MGRRPVEIELSAEEEAELQRWRRRRNTSNALHVRAGIVLDCAREFGGEEIAERHNTSQQTVTKWRRRFAKLSLTALMAPPMSALMAPLEGPIFTLQTG